MNGTKIKFDVYVERVWIVHNDQWFSIFFALRKMRCTQIGMCSGDELARDQEMRPV